MLKIFVCPRVLYLLLFFVSKLVDANPTFNEEKLQKVIGKNSTPLYIYSKEKIKSNFNAYYNAFKERKIDRFTVAYAVKANFNHQILKSLSYLGSGADVVSLGELKVAHQAGIPYKKIVFSGVGKTNKELEYAIQKDILQINIESEEELQEIIKITKKLNKVAKISFRVNPNVANAGGNDKISTGGKENKFGISFEETEKLIKSIIKEKNIQFVGLSMHIGSQMLNLDKLKVAFESLKMFVDRLKNEGIKINRLDLGGGLGISYSGEEAEEKLLELKKDFVNMIVDTFGSGYEFIIEPGRSIVGDAGILASRVTYIKKTEEKNFAITEAGMNSLLRPALYKAVHRIVPLHQRENSEQIIYDIVGPICESSDVFIKDYKMQKLSQGDIILLLDAGAYGYSMASDYNLRGKPQEVVLDSFN